LNDENPERTEVNNETRAENDVEEEHKESTELKLCVEEKEEGTELVLCDEDEIGAYVKVRLGDGVARDSGRRHVSRCCWWRWARRRQRLWADRTSRTSAV